MIVGSNDGMLHAFAADTGEELWAFIPEYALPRLADIAAPTYCHTYAVDLPPALTDVKIAGHWRTIVVCGSREGGASYFALDVTEPDDPEFLWECTTPDGFDYPSEIEFAMINDVAMMLVGSGVDEIGGEARLYAFDLEDGQAVGSGELYLSGLGGGRNKATTPKALDMNLDGETDVVYCGDLAGTMWRIECGGHEDPGNWNVSELFEGSHPITAEPTVAFGEGNQPMVYFGTGAYLDIDDVTALDQEYFYCVKDDQSGNTSRQSDLVDQTNDIGDIGEADGWFIRLEEETGERVTEPAVVVAGTTFFTSFAPSCEPCNAGGASWLYRLDYADGGVQDGEDGEDGDEARITSLGDGVASRAVVDLANETVIVQSSDATIAIEDIGTAVFRLIVRSWQESYDMSEYTGYIPEGDGQPDENP